ncbi:MAG: penicillin-binding protein 2 [Actinomycetota bacterium]|nr:penicillin-binding protein 2 [Actinomycetota bacterium]
MNAHLRRTFYLFVAGFVGLVVMLAYWQVYQREALANNPQNGFQTQRAIQSPRGLILARDGETVLAQSEKRRGISGPVYERSYPGGAAFTGVVGYWSTKYGATGIEIGRNSDLSSVAGDPETVDDLINRATGGPQPGNNVILTLDPELQQLAYEALSETVTARGSAMAIDPKTGEILALATYPSFDANNIDENLPELSQRSDAPLINRATQSLYPPGSTFKVITSAAALRAGVQPSDKFFDPGYLDTPGYRVTNYQNRDFGTVTFAAALAFSINVIFAKIAINEVGAQLLYETATAFGFGDPYDDFPLLVAASDLGYPVEEWVEGNTAQISFGQDRVVSNVFEMGLVAATVANDGTMMEPRIVKSVRSPDGIILDQPAPSVRRRVLDPATANTLNAMMQNVIVTGQLTEAEIPGVKVAGKTGTAEAPPREPHSWFISFAPADDPKIAVAVMVENGGEIGPQGDAATPAIPIAQDLMETYLKNEGG